MVQSLLIARGNKIDDIVAFIKEKTKGAFAKDLVIGYDSKSDTTVMIAVGRWVSYYKDFEIMGFSIVRLKAADYIIANGEKNAQAI